MNIPPSTWKAFLQSHEDRDKYIEQADSIQKLVSPNENPQNNFRLLSENKTIPCISRSQWNKDIQITFFHSTKKIAILSPDSDCFGLIGFSERSYAVRLNPEEIFRLSSQKKRIPSFEDLLSCRSIQQVNELVPNQSMDLEKLQSHALLPPELLDTLFDLEDFSAQNILIILVKKIYEKIQESLPNADENKDQDKDSDSEEDLDEANEEATLSEKEMETELVLSSAEKKYSKILTFIWSIVHHDNSVKSVAAIPCTKPSTVCWLNKLHEDFLSRKGFLSPQRPSLRNYPSPSANIASFQNVATSLCRLSNTLEHHHEQELKTKEEKQKKKEKQEFDKLSEVQRNTIILLTVKEFHQPGDETKLEVTDMMKTLIEQGTSIRVQSQLQHEFSKKKYICDLSSSMCTSIKQGTLASQPTARDINGLSPFCTPNENKDDKLDYATRLCLNEQIEIGKIAAEDVKQLTKLSITFPQDFNTYRHFLRNFALLISLLTGPSSLLTLSLDLMVSHAEDNEQVYRDHGDDEWTFFPSLLDHIHRRVQTYIHSAGFGEIQKLNKKQLDFSSLQDSIENSTYQYFTPRWLKSKKRPSSDGNKISNKSTSSFSSGSDGHKKRKYGKGE